MKMRRFSWLILFLLVCIPFLPAQDLSHFIYDDNQGLPSREVYGVHIDTFGYLWAGTAFGLARFDGEVFQTMTFPNQKGSSYSSLQSDFLGRIWAHNFVGQIICADIDSVRVLKAYSDSIAKPYAFFGIHQKKWLYVVGKQGFWKAEIKADIDLMYFLPANDEMVSHVVFASDRFGVLFANPEKGLMLQKEQQKPKLILSISPPQQYRSAAFEYDSTLYLVINDTKQLYQLSKSGRSVELNNRLSKLFQTIRGNINSIKKIGNHVWIATESGVYILNKDLKPDSSFWPALQSFNCSDVAQDKDGRYWVSTLSDGILLVPSLALQSLNSTDPNQKIDKISVVESDGKTVWMGTRKGELFTYSIEKKTVQKHAFSSDYPIQLISLNPFTKSAYVLTNNTLHQLNKTGGNLKRNQPRAIKSMFWLDEAHVLTAESGGFYFETIGKRSHQDKWFHPILEKAAIEQATGENLLPGNQTIVFADSVTKTIWIGGRSGLYQLTEFGFTEIRHPEKDEAIYPFKWTQDYKGNFWIGSISGEVFVFQGKKLQAWGASQIAIKGSSIRAMMSDQKGVWISTNSGLQFLGYDSLKLDSLNTFSANDWIYLDKNNGLLSNELTGLANVGDALLMASFNGLQRMERDHIQKKMAEPTTVLHELLVSGNRRKVHSFFSLPYDSNRIQFSISGVSLGSGNMMQLKWRMKGLDSTWTTQTRIHETVNYPELQPGTYVFEVKSVNKQGVESANSIQIPLEIRKPFWLSWWFLLLMIVLALLIIVIIFKYRMNKQRKELEERQARKQLENELNLSRLHALQSQMNPHFMYNALNSIQHFIFTNDKRASNHFLGKFADLMRLVMQQSSQETISLKEELETLETYLELEKMRLDDAFTYVFKVHESLDSSRVVVPPMIIQPYLENAIKHGFMGLKRKGFLHIHFQQIEDFLEVCIEDNGRGRQQAHQQQQKRKFGSFSGQANQRRFELLKQRYGNQVSVWYEDKKDEQEQALGTIVYLHLPLILHDEHG